MRKRKIVLIFLVFIFVICPVVLTVLYRYTTIVDTSVLKVINHFVKEQNVRVNFQRLSGNLFGTIRIDNLSVASEKDTLACHRVELDYSILDVLRKRYIIHRLTVLHPILTIYSEMNNTATPDTAGINLDSLVAQYNLDGMPLVSIDHFEIKNGKIRVHKQSGDENIDNINLSLNAYLSPQKIELHPEKIGARWENRDLVLDKLTFGIAGTTKQLSISDIDLRLSGLTLHGNGKIDIRPDLNFNFVLDTTVIDVARIKKHLPQMPFHEGVVNISAKLSGKPDNFIGSILASGQFDQLELRHFTSEIQRKNKEIHVTEFEMNTNFGYLTAEALFSKFRQKRLVGRFAEINLQMLDLLESPTNLNGHFNVSFENYNFSAFTGHGTLALNTISIGESRIDTVSLKISAKNGNWQIQKPSHINFGKNSRFDASGRLSNDNILDIQLITEENNLGEMAGQLGLKGLGGIGNLRLNLTGPLDDPSLLGSVLIDSVSYDKTVIYGIDGSVDISNIVKNRQGHFNLELATGYIGDVFLTSGDIQLLFDGNRITLEPFQFFSEENSIQSAGYLDLDDSLLSFALSDFRLEYEHYLIRNDAPILIRLQNNNELQVDKFSLIAADSGRMDISGKIFLNEGDSELRLRLQNILLDPFNQYLYWKHQLTGFVEAEMNLYGELANPEIDLSISMNELKIDENEIGKAIGDFSIADRHLAVNVLSFEGDDGSYFDINGSVDVTLGEVGNKAEFKLNEDIPLGLNIVFGNLELGNYDFLFATTYPIQGQVTGRLDLSGSWQNPRGELSLQGKNLLFADYAFPDVRLKSQLEKNKIILSDGDINFLNTNIKIHGEKNIWWNPEQFDSLFADKYFELYAEIAEDSINFLNVVNPNLERLIGDIRAKASLKGDYDNPDVEQMEFTINNGTLFLSKLENGIKELNATAHLEKNRLMIDKLTARSAKPGSSGHFLSRWVHALKSIFGKNKESGHIIANGYVDLEDVFRPRVNIGVKLDEAYFNYFLENTEVIVSSKKITVTGRDTILVAGDAVISQGDIELDFVESEKNLLFETTIRETPPFVTYNLNLDILPNFHVRSFETLNSFDLKLSGDLRVISEPRSELEMYGSLETSGAYFIQGEDFRIESGQINFVNPKELPEINLTARTQKRDQITNDELVFLLKVHGKIDAPEKDIVVQDAQGNTLQYDVKDQLALLLFGMRFDQLSRGDAQQLILNRGEQVLTQAVISTIEREARGFTGLDEIRLESQDSFFKNRLNQPSTLALGKYLTPNLYLEYRSQLASTGLGNVPAPSLSWEAGNQIYLQYRLNRQWSFSSFYQKTLEGDEKVQFDINWQIGF